MRKLTGCLLACEEMVFGPDEQGHLKPCGDQPWAKDKPLGCKRVHEVWLRNRLQHVQNEGRLVPEPNWARIAGATELSDLVHWMYDEKQQQESSIDMALDLDFQDPEWLQAAAFQLPLDVRRAMQQREATMSDEVKQKREKKREKRREKTKKRREGREAAKKIGDEEKEEMRLALQSTSRHLAST